MLTGMLDVRRAVADESLPDAIRADALEEAGDPRAAMFRQVAQIHRPAVVELPGGKFFGWQFGFGHAHSVSRYNQYRARPKTTFAERLKNLSNGVVYGDWVLFDTRSAALLALAEALIPE